MMRQCRRWTVLVFVMLLGATGLGPAPSALAAAAAPPAPPATTAGGSLSQAQHYARGEVQFGDHWVPIATIFKDYQAACVQLKDLTDRAEAARLRPTKVSDELNRARVESAAEEKPIRQEIYKARSIQIKNAKVLAEPPPQKPVPKPIPPEPTGAAGAWTHNENNWNINPAQIHAAWERRSNAIQKENQAAEDAYNKALAEYKQKHDEAQKQRDEATATIKECGEKLATIAAELKAKQQEIQAGAATAAQDAQQLDQETAALKPKHDAMAATLHAAPEDLRLKHGILEWQGAYYSPDEIQKLIADLDADAAKAKEKAKADAALAGTTLPLNWRSARQGDIDSLKALLNKAKAAAPGAAS